MNRLLIVLLMLISFGIKAQTVLLEQHVDEDTLKENYGPNLKHFMYTYISYGLVAGSSGKAGLPVKYGSAGEIVWGFRYKHKLSEIFSCGLGLNYSAQYYPLKQDSSKVYPTNVHHKKERYAFNNIGADLFARINFDKKRGNMVGTYLDLGGTLDWPFLLKHYTKVQNPSGSASKYTETTNTGLFYANPVNYGASIKFGYKSIAVYAKYRISDVFKASYGIPELPRFLFGIELGTIN